MADPAGFITVYPDGHPIRPCLDTEPDECKVFRSWEQADVGFTQATLTGALVATRDRSQPISIAVIHGTADNVFDWDGIGSFPSVPETVAIWAEFNRCVGDRTIEWLPDIADDSTRVWTETHDNCAGGAEVMGTPSRAGLTESVEMTDPRRQALPQRAQLAGLARRGTAASWAVTS